VEGIVFKGTASAVPHMDENKLSFKGAENLGVVEGHGFSRAVGS